MFWRPLLCGKGCLSVIRDLNESITLPLEINESWRFLVYTWDCGSEPLGQSVSVLHVFMVNCSPWTRDVPRLNVTNTNVSESVSVLAAFQEKSWRSVVCLSWITVVRCYQKLSERNLLIRLIWKFLKALRF